MNPERFETLALEDDAFLEELRLSDAPSDLISRFSAKVGIHRAHATIPQIWMTHALRSAVLDFLLQNAFFDEYLFRSRDFLRECLKINLESLEGKIERICYFHVALGAADIFLKEFSSLRHEAVPWKWIFGRVFAETGRIAEAITFLENSLDADEFHRLFALGWLESHFGDPLKARLIRDELDLMACIDVRKAIGDVTPERCANLLRGNTNVLEVFPFVRHSVASFDPELAAASAMLVRATLNILHVNTESNADLSNIFVEDVRTTSPQKKHELSLGGINPWALEINAGHFETNEVLGSSFEDCRLLASRLKKRSDLDFFRGCWGTLMQQEAYNGLELYRGIDAARGLTCICPRTLQLMISTESYYWNGFILYRFCGEFSFWIISVRLSTRGWYWDEDRDILIGLAPGAQQSNRYFIRKELRYFQEFLVRNSNLVASYRSSPRNVAVLTGIIEHIGHHYHNELAGLYRVFREGLLNNFSSVVKGPFDYYAAFDVLGFPSDASFMAKSDDELSLLVLRECLFLVWPTDAAAPRDLGDIIYKKSKSMDLNTRARECIRSLDVADLKIVWGLRTKQRVWRGQLTVLQDLLPRIVFDAQQYGFRKVAFCFDGYTATETSSSDQLDIISYERSVLEMAIQNIRGAADVLFLDCIGFTLYEKARVFGTVDFAVCTKGMGHLPTLAWVTRIPSIIHSNSADIKDALFENMLCDECASIAVIDRSYVTDQLGNVPSDYRWKVDWARFMQQDYDLCTEIVYAKIRDFIKRAAQKRETR